MKTKIDKAREIVDALFYNDHTITQWQWELLLEVINEAKPRTKPSDYLDDLSIADLSVSIDVMRDLNELAMRDKVRSNSFTESQKPLKMIYPYPETLITKLEKEVQKRLQQIKKMK